DGSSISIGHKIGGLASRGLHSNGFSLVRHGVEAKSLDLHKVYEPVNRPLGEILLEPSHIYVNQVLTLKGHLAPLGVAHFPGRGLVENRPRILPKTCWAVLKKDSWERPPLFHLLQDWGSIPEKEMLRVFNCGIGLLLVVEQSHAEEIVARLQSLGDKAWIIG